MVKMTIVGRVSDGLPIAQSPRYVNEEDENFSSYKQQAKFIRKEISRTGSSLAPSKMTIRLDLHQHCFKMNGSREGRLLLWIRITGVIDIYCCHCVSDFQVIYEFPCLYIGLFIISC
ncbi:unnamed protein product [Camellia sinensis]